MLPFARTKKRRCGCLPDFMNGFVGDVKWFSSGNTAPSYNGNVFRAVQSHMNYLLNHDVVDASFQKEDRKQILDELKQYQTRYDARVAGKFFMSLPNDFDLKQIPQFIAETLPAPVKFEYVAHEAQTKMDKKIYTCT